MDKIKLIVGTGIFLALTFFDVILYHFLKDIEATVRRPIHYSWFMVYCFLTTWIAYEAYKYFTKDEDTNDRGQ